MIEFQVNLYFIKDLRNLIKYAYPPMNNYQSINVLNRSQQLKFQCFPVYRNGLGILLYLSTCMHAL